MPPSDKRKPGQKETVNKGDKLTQELSAKALCKDANGSKCVWARVKGYPWWPAQVLSKAAAKQHLGNVTHKSKSDVPVIFFGTSEIAWIGCKDVSNWEEGMRQSFHSKGRKNKKFVVALEQVRDFLSITTERIAPHGWWCPAPARNAPPVPDEPFTSDEEEDLQQEAELPAWELQRQFSGIGRYGVAAIAAAAAAADGSLEAHLQHAATVAADAAAAAATVAAGITRHSTLGDEDELGYGSSRRSAYSRQPLWKTSGSRRGSETGQGMETNHFLQNRRRRGSNNGHAATDSWSDQEDQQEEEYAVVDPNRGGSRGHYSGFMQRRKRQLLQQEGQCDASEGEMTDTESVAMAAMAIAELAQCSSWDQRHPELAAEAAAAAAAEVEEEPMMQVSTVAAATAVVGPAAAAEQLDSLVKVELKVQGDGVGVGVVARPVVPVAGGSCHHLPPHLGLPPIAAAHHKAHLSALGSLVAAAGVDDVSADQLSDNFPIHPPGKYAHGGEGLPCSCSWKYSVAMPCAAPPAGDSMRRPAVPAVAMGSSQQQQQQAAGSEEAMKVEQLGEASDEPCKSSAAGANAADEQQQAVQEVPPVSTCVGSAYYRHLFASFGHTPADTDEQDAADDASAAAVDSHHAVAAVAPVVERAAAASAAPVPLGPRRARASVPKYIAAANAAIMAAFSGSVPASHAAAAVTATATIAGCSTSSAARSDGSGSSATASGSRGMLWQRKRPNGTAAVTAAAAAAAAAAHVLTPADSGLDPLVSRLLLDNEPVLPGPGLSQLGFQLPREMLLNRPPKFEMLKRNLFVSRERPKRLPKDEVSVCCCRPKKAMMPDGTIQLVGCDSECLNRLSFIHCDPRTCPCGQYCTNKPFHLLKAPELDVFLTENRGHGVRVTGALPPGTFVMEYAGEVIDQAELNRRMEAARDSGEQHFYIMEMGPGLFIDARKKGNNARLLNSCCDPNCETQKWRDAATGEVRIGIFTTRQVTAQEELTYDYMFEHYGLSSGLAQGFKCQCGAKNCRGTMDINPERKKDWGRRLEVFWEGDGVFYRGTIWGYSVSSGKHMIMYDDGDMERVNLSQVPHRWLDGDASPHSSAQPASGSPAPKAGARPSPLPVTQPLLQGLITEAADSGSWSQTEQEAAAADEQLLSSPRTAAAAGRVGPGGAARVLGLSPLGPGGAAAAAANMYDAAPAAGIKRPGHHIQQVEEGALDDEAAADALVVLGMAAEAELAEHTQLQQGGRGQLAAVADDMQFQRPQSKKRRLDGYSDPPGFNRAQWPHSSSTSSQTHIGFGNGALDGASPLSPAGRVGGVAGRTLPGLNQTGARVMVDNDAMDVDHPAAAAAAANPSSEEYLPWEQLLNGISAIKRQGPSLFQPADVVAAKQRVAAAAPVSRAAVEALQASRDRFGQLLDLVGQLQPVIQQKQLKLSGVLGMQQVHGMGVDHSKLSAGAARIGRAGSSGVSSSCSTNSACHLPLFCCGGIGQPQQQPHRLGSLGLPGAGVIHRVQLQQGFQQGLQQQQAGGVGQPVQQQYQQQLLQQQQQLLHGQHRAPGPAAAWQQQQQQRACPPGPQDVLNFQQKVLQPPQQLEQAGGSLAMPLHLPHSAAAGLAGGHLLQQQQQQQLGLQGVACHPLQAYHRSSASFTGSSASSNTALQHPALTAAVSSAMAAAAPASLRQQQQPIQLQISFQQQQLPQQQAAAGPSPSRTQLISVNGNPGPPAANANPAVSLQHLQALKAAAAAAAAGVAQTAANVGLQGSLGSAGSGGSPVSAGSSGTAGGPVVVATAGSITAAPAADAVAAAAAAGMLNMLQAQAVAQ